MDNERFEFKDGLDRFDYLSSEQDTINSLRTTTGFGKGMTQDDI
jgi:hypothetical protein